MPPERSSRFLIPALALALGACSSGPAQTPVAERLEPVARQAADAEAARHYLAAIDEFGSAAPARQAELLQGARRDAEVTPTTVNRLRYALFLAQPGHGGADPALARRQLSEILARPELMLPAERALTALALKDVEARLVLEDANRRLTVDRSTGDHDQARVAAQAKRLAQELDENARLRRLLEDAQKKLDAVTQVERSITERGKAPDKP
jgi:hypothetical protein